MFTRFKKKPNLKSLIQVLKIRSNNTSGYTGVYFHKPSRRWRAVGIGKERKTIGNFLRIEDAIEARRNEEIRQGFIVADNG